MKRKMRKSILGILLGILIFLPSVFVPSMITAQEAENQDIVILNAQTLFELAQTLMNEKEYLAAANEYIRFYHLFPNHEQTLNAKYQTGVAYFYAGRLADAKRHLEQTATPYTDSGFASDAMFKLGELHMAAGELENAISVLKNLITLTRDVQVRDRASYICAWLLIDNADKLISRTDFKVNPIKEAQTFFSMISPEGQIKYGVDQDLMMGVAGIDQVKKKDPGTAGVLSLVPGAGFLYCERYQDAFVSFVLNSTLILAAYRSFENDNPFLGGAICFVETGFFTGNIYGAVSSAHKYNRQKKTDYTEKLKQQYSKRPGKLSLQPGMNAKSIGLVFNYKF